MIAAASDGPEAGVCRFVPDMVVKRPGVLSM